MDPAQERLLRKQSAETSERLRGGATQDPRQGGGGGGFQQRRPAAVPAQPAAEPYTPQAPSNAAEMGGAVDTGAPPVQYGPNGERVGPQSRTFGNLFTNEDANNLVRIVQRGRLAQQVASSKAPSFGEVAADTRAQQAAAAQQEAVAADQQAQQAAAQKQIMQSLRFLVHTKTGEFEPVMPDDEDPRPGPHDIVVSFGDDPSQPNILAQGKRVTATTLARLSDPRRGMQPSLRKGYKVPPQYAGIAKALGLEEEAS